MEYTIQQLARIAGISTRTLRYYDEIGLLKPARTSPSGYRIYGQREVNQLQHILFYRELGVSLEVIRKILTDPLFDRAKALRRHREQLLDKRKRLDKLMLDLRKCTWMMNGLAHFTTLNNLAWRSFCATRFISTPG